MEALPEDGLAVLNAADPYLPRLQAKTTAQVVTYGTAENIAQAEAGWRFTVRGVPVEIQSLSRHDTGNALWPRFDRRRSFGRVRLTRTAKALAALKSYAPPPMRMQRG